MLNPQYWGENRQVGAKIVAGRSESQRFDIAVLRNINKSGEEHGNCQDLKITLRGQGQLLVLSVCRIITFSIGAK